MYFVISSIKLIRFWWNLVYCFPNKSAANHVYVFNLTAWRSVRTQVRRTCCSIL